LVSYSCVFVT